MAEKYEKLKRMRADIEKSRTRIEKLNEDLEHKLQSFTYEKEKRVNSTK